MYRKFFRPLLFLIKPEAIHRMLVVGVGLFFAIPGMRRLFKRLCTITDSRLERDVFGLHFSNPVGLAAGFDKNAEFYENFSAFGFSFIEIGTVTPRPQPGNPKPRSFRIPKDHGLINRMGFNNKGVAYAAKNLTNRKPGLIIGGNLGKNTDTPNQDAIHDFETGLRQLYDAADYFAINVSCPNISDLTELQDRDSLLQILTRLIACRSELEVKKPILLKISPDLNWEQIDDVIDIVKETGIDGIIATNTTTRRNNLLTPASTLESIGRGGMSGAPLTQRSTEIIRYIAEKTGGTLPIIGVGGIMNPEDAIEKIKAGAVLVQVYTGFIYEGPMIAKKICKALLKDLPR